MDFLNYNGKLITVRELQLDPDSRAFRYGNGLFETMLLQNGKPRLLELHWERLQAGMQMLGMSFDPHFGRDRFEAELLRCCAKNHATGEVRIRFQVWPGSGGYFDRDGFSPDWLIETFPVSPGITGWKENGLVTGTYALHRKHFDGLAAFKTCNALIYSLAARYALEQRWNDALVLNTEGNIIESTIANIFWWEGDTLFTPPLSEGCIAGVMRRHILEETPSAGIIIEQAPLNLERLLAADECFLSNAVRGISWVQHIEGRSYGFGKTLKLYHALFGK